VCRNSGALVVASASPDEATTTLHDNWVRELEPLPDIDQGLCAVLDP
jgi:hypothetical protein